MIAATKSLFPSPMAGAYAWVPNVPCRDRVNNKNIFLYILGFCDLIADCYFWMLRCRHRNWPLTMFQTLSVEISSSWNLSVEISSTLPECLKLNQPSPPLSFVGVWHLRIRTPKAAAHMGKFIKLPPIYTQGKIWAPE